MRASRWSRTTIALDLWRAERAGARGLAARQARRLAELVRFARARSPYFAAHYRSLPEGPVELATLPPTRKPQLMARFDEWVTDPRLSLAEIEAHVAQPALVGSRLRGRYVVWSSSGTTGHPGRFLQDAGALAVYRALSTRIDRAWLRLPDWLALTRGGFHWTSVLATGGHFAGEAWNGLERERSRWRRSTWSLVPVQQPLERTVAALNEQAPAILTLYPSTALMLAEEQRAGRLHIKPTLIELSGEAVTASEVALVADAFHAPIHQVYACSECLLVGADCREGWIHVNDDWTIIEPVDRELRATPAGTASHTVLLSNLANWVQPILRYDLGDSVVVNDRPCACGSRLTAIRVSGRRDGPVRVQPTALASLLSQVSSLRRGQLVQRGRDTIEARLEPAAGSTREEAWGALEPKLRALLTTLGAGATTLRLSPEAPRQEPQSGKLRQVIAMPEG